MSYNRIGKITLAALLFLVGYSSPSWAWWRGGGGWYGGRGWWGPRFGVYVGPGPYAYPPYYDPYYSYPDSYPYTYADTSYTASASPTAAPNSETNNSRRDLRYIENQIDQQRAQINHDYDDGDISADARDSQLRTLDQIEKQARDLDSANGGFITGDQENALLRQLRGEPANPPAPASQEARTPSDSESTPAIRSASRRDLNAINDLQLELRMLLDQKLKEGAITSGQHDAEKQILDKLQSQGDAQAAANGGTLTADQEDALIQKLHQAYYLINHNFIGG